MAGLTKAYAAGLNAKRRAYRSKSLVLELLDKFVDPDTLEPNNPDTATEPFTTVATVTRGWDYKRLSSGEQGEERISISVAESITATEALLDRCDFRIGTTIYVPSKREKPIGEVNRIWYFIASPSG